MEKVKINILVKSGMIWNVMINEDSEKYDLTVYDADNEPDLLDQFEEDSKNYWQAL